MPSILASSFEKLLDGVIGSGTGQAFQVSRSANQRSFQASVIGTGAVSATVLVEVSNDDITYSTRGTITLSGTSSANDIYLDVSSFPFVRGNLTSISGTDAKVNLTMVA